MKIVKRREKNDYPAKDLFIRYLMELGAYDNFFSEFYTKRAVNFRKRNLCPVAFMNLFSEKKVFINILETIFEQAFDWNLSKNGYSYWKDISFKLRELEVVDLI